MIAAVMLAALAADGLEAKVAARFPEAPKAFRLLERPRVRQELGLDQGQAASLRLVEQETRAREADQARWAEWEGLPGAQGLADATVRETLRPGQWLRLRQVRGRVAGDLAAFWDEWQPVVGLTAEQRRNAHALLDKDAAERNRGPQRSPGAMLEWIRRTHARTQELRVALSSIITPSQRAKLEDALGPPLPEGILGHAPSGAGGGNLPGRPAKPKAFPGTLGGHHPILHYLLCEAVMLELDLSDRQRRGIEEVVNKEKAAHAAKVKEMRAAKDPDETWRRLLQESYAPGFRSNLEASLKRELTDAQWRRLQEIRWQYRRLDLAYEADGAALLNVTKGQVDALHEAIRQLAKRTDLDALEGLRRIHQAQWDLLTEPQRRRFGELAGKPIGPELEAALERTLYGGTDEFGLPARR